MNGRRLEVARASASMARTGIGAWGTHAALLVVQLAFGAQAVEGKIAMQARTLGGEGIDPRAVAMVRMLAAAIFFQVVTRAFGMLRPTTWRDRGSLALLSVLGIAANQTLYLIGLRTTSPINATLISMTIPVFTATIAILVRQELASVRTALGIAVAFGGVLSLTGLRAIDVGAIVIVLNSLSYSLYLVLSRGTILRLGAFTVVTWLFTWGAILFAPIGLLPLAQGAPSWTPRGFALLGFIVLAPTIVAYLFNAWALGRSRASLVTIYVFVQPLVTALLNWIQRGEALTSRTLVATGLIGLGVAIVATRKLRVDVRVEQATEAR